MVDHQLLSHHNIPMKRLNRTAADVLSMLRDQEAPLSGEEMARRLSLSRTAVWKAVASLRQEAFVIQGVHKAGYLLQEESPELSPAGIGSALSSFWKDLDVITYDQVTSTNSLAKERAGEGGSFLLAAGEQTLGRGRRGRGFYSPPESGIYFSLAFPWKREEAPVLLTTMAAVAAARVLDRTFGKEVAIKWVNDLFLDDRKIAGILTEAVTDLETGSAVFIVLGLGINIHPPAEGFPDGLKGIAGSLLDDQVPFSRNLLIARIVNELGRIMEELPARDYLEEYKRRCFILGREILLSTGQRVTARDISDEGALIAEGGEGLMELSSGEISLVEF